MDVEPFPQAVEQQEVLPAGLAELAVRKLGFQLMEKVPDLQITDEIGLVVGPQGVAGVGRLLFFQRPLARVLHSNAAAMISTSCRQPSSAAARIIRPNRGSTGKRLNWRPISVSSPVGPGAGLDERAVAVAHGLRLGRVEEREPLDRAQPQGLGLQNDGGQVGPLDFRDRVGVAPR